MTAKDSLGKRVRFRRKQLALSLVLALASIAAFAESSPSIATVDTKIALPRLSGEYINVSDFCYPGPGEPGRKRSVVVLNFMSTTCAPCIRELPLFIETVKTFKSKDVRTFLISLDPLSRRSDLEDTLKLMSVSNTTAEVLMDPYRVAAKKLGVDAIPRVMVLSPQAEIVADWKGFNGNLKKELGAAVDKALSYGEPGSAQSVSDRSAEAPPAAPPAAEPKTIPVTYMGFVTVREDAADKELVLADFVPSNLVIKQIKRSEGDFDREEKKLSVKGLKAGEVVFFQIDGELKLSP